MLPTVLIADDDKSLHSVVKRMLKDTPYKLRSAYNGMEALAAAKASPPDVILLDINMPDKDGLEVLAELRENPATRNICVVPVSEAPLQSNRMDRSSFPVQDCIPKPFDANKLQERISHALRHSEEILPEANRAVLPLESQLEKLSNQTVRRGRQINAAFETLSRRLNKLEQKQNEPPKKAAPWSWHHAPTALAGVALGTLVTFSLLHHAPSNTPIPLQASFAPIIPAQQTSAPGLPPATAKKKPRPIKQGNLAPKGPVLRSIRRQHFRVTLNTTQPVHGRAVYSPKENAVVLELPETRSGLKRRNLPGYGKLITRVRVLPTKTKSSQGTRVMIYLARPVSYKITQNGKKILVDFFYGGRVMK